MTSDTLKTELRTLAEAQQAFEREGWIRTGSVQKEQNTNSLAYGTIFEKGDKTFYLNIHSASKALQTLKK